jgi:hypothetical protein
MAELEGAGEEVQAGGGAAAEKAVKSPVMWKREKCSPIVVRLARSYSLHF